MARQRFSTRGTQASSSVILLMRRPDRAAGVDVLGGPDRGVRLDVLGHPHPAVGVDVLGGPDRGVRLDVLGHPHPATGVDVLGGPDRGVRIDVMGPGDRRVVDLQAGADELSAYQDVTALPARRDSTPQQPPRAA